MTIQQHASFDSSAAELNATSKLVKAWESKNAKNAAKAGGISLMALSLAACGGSSTTAVVDTTPVITQAELDAANAAATAAAAAQATAEAAQAAAEAAQAAAEADLAAVNNPDPVTIALTDDDTAGVTADILEAELTIADDTLTATGTAAAGAGTLDDTDIIADPSTTDNDTLTVTIVHGNATTEGPTSITNIENIVYNDMNFAALSSIDLGGITGSNVTVNVAQAGTAVTGMTVTAVGTGMTVNAGTAVTGTMSVTMAAGSDAIVNTNDAATVSVVAGAAADTITVNITDDIAITADVATTLNLSSSAEATATFTDIEELTTINASGAGAITLISTAADTINAFDGATVTGFAKISTSGSATATDLTGVDSATVIEIDDATNSTLTVGATATIQLEATGQDITLDYSDGTVADVNTSATVIVDDNAAAVATIAAADVVLNDTDSTDTISTLNVVLNENVTSLNLTSAGNADVNGDGTAAEPANITYNLSGAGDATLDADANTHGSVNASAMTGDLSATVQTDLLTLTGGAGADNITIGTTALAYVLDGGAGTDTITVTANADLSNATLTNFEVFAGNFEITVAASQISGQSFSTANSDFIVDVIDVATMDFSTLTIGTAADGVVTTAVFGGSVSGSTALNITGTAGTDSFTTGGGADTINAGGGADTIVGGDGLNVLNGGGGADSITGGADADIINGGAGDDVTLAGGGGADTIDGGAGADTITGGGGVDTITGGEGIDTITGGAGADIIDLTEATAVTDDVNIAVHSTDGVDVITGFKAGALASGGDTIGTTAGVAVAYNDLTGEDFSAAATLTAAATLAIVEDNTTNSTDGQNDAIAFMYDTNMYVVVQTDGDAAAFATATDALVQLVGVDAADLVVANFIA